MHRASDVVVPCALFVIGSLCLQMAGAFVLQQPGPDRKALIEFFRFVLANDDRWWFVLDQLVTFQGSDLSPPYLNRSMNVDTNEMIRLFDDEDKHILPRKLLIKVIDKYWWLGSYVDYAARVLGTAFQCITFLNFMMVADMFLKFETNHKEPDEDESTTSPGVKKGTDKSTTAADVEKGTDKSTSTPDVENGTDKSTTAADVEKGTYKSSSTLDDEQVTGAVIDVVAALSVFTEKLAMLHVDLSVMGELLVVYTDRIRHRAERSGGNYPAFDVMEDVLFTRCVADEYIYHAVAERLGINIPETGDGRSAAKLIVEKLIYHYENLQVDLLPKETWLQIIGYPDHMGMEITKENRYAKGAKVH